MSTHVRVGTCTRSVKSGEGAKMIDMGRERLGERNNVRERETQRQTRDKDKERNGKIHGWVSPCRATD